MMGAQLRWQTFSRGAARRYFPVGAFWLTGRGLLNSSTTSFTDVRRDNFFGYAAPASDLPAITPPRMAPVAQANGTVRRAD